MVHIDFVARVYCPLDRSDGPDGPDAVAVTRLHTFHYKLCNKPDRSGTICLIFGHTEMLG